MKKEQTNQVLKGKTAIVTIPRDNFNDTDNYQFVGINSRTYSILKGVATEVPVDVANVLVSTGIISDYILK